MQEIITQTKKKNNTLEYCCMMSLTLYTKIFCKKKTKINIKETDKCKRDKMVSEICLQHGMVLSTKVLTVVAEL